jgi:transcriptional regulator
MSCARNPSPVVSGGRFDALAASTPGADQARIGFLLTVESTLGMLASRQSRGAAYQGVAVRLPPFSPLPGSSCPRTVMMGKPTELLQGTLDLLVLKTLALEPMHGWGITLRIQQITGDVLQVRPGALYPALHRLEHQGWITAKWGETAAARRAKYYSLTRAGRLQLERESEQWRRLSSAVTALLDTV